MMPSMTPDLQQYLDAKFAVIQDTLEDISSELKKRGAEYGIVMQAIRLLAQRLSTEDALDNLIETLEGQRKQIAAKRKKT